MLHEDENYYVKSSLLGECLCVVCVCVCVCVWRWVGE